MNYNNTYFNHVYSLENVYNVSVFCKNLYSNASYSVQHSVYVPITGLALMQNSSYLNRNFAVWFSIANGTNPNFQFTFNNSIISHNFSTASMTGITSNLFFSFPGYYNLIIRAWNQISTANLTTEYLITYEPITNLFAVKTSGTCVNFASCYFSSSIVTGQNVVYTWYSWGIGFNSTVTTDTTSVFFTYPSSGLYFVRVSASNPVSNVTSNNVSVTIVNYVTGITFFAANPYNTSQSASPVNKNARYSI